MAKAAQSSELKAAFDTHRDETEGQVDRLEKVFELIGKRAQGKISRRHHRHHRRGQGDHGGV